MKRPRLSARDARALMLGALLCGGFMFSGFVVRPYAMHMTNRRESIARERDLLRREQSLLAAAERIPSRLLRAETAAASLHRLSFLGPDPVATTAYLASYATSLAQAHEVRVDRSVARSATEGDAGTEIRVSLSATGDVIGLMSWLTSLQQGDKLVIVERIDVERMESGYDETTGEYAENPVAGSEPMRLTFELLAYHESLPDPDRS